MTGSLWPVTQPCGLECCWKTPVYPPRCVAELRFDTPSCHFSQVRVSPSLVLSVPQHPVPVVHSDAFTHPAEPQAQTARKEGKQGRLCEKHTVREKQDNVWPIWDFFFYYFPESFSIKDKMVLEGLHLFLVALLSCLDPSGCLEEGLEAMLKATGSNLLILKISHCPNLLTDRSLWLASCYCRALQAVTYR